MLDSSYEAYDFEYLTVTNGAAVGPAAAKLIPASGAAADALRITVEGPQIRYREEGSPTTTDGHLRHDGSEIQLFGRGAQACKFIATGADVKLSITFYRRKR